MHLSKVAMPPLSLASFMRNTGSLEELCLWNVSLEPLNTSNDEASELASAFRDNGTLERWSFFDHCSSSVCIPILQGLQWNRKVESLSFSGFLSRECSHAFRGVLESSQNALLSVTFNDGSAALQEGELFPLVFDQQCFEAVAQGLQSRKKSLVLSFEFCRFDQGSIRVFLQCTDFASH
jgi:hypothetical protein